MGSGERRTSIGMSQSRSCKLRALAKRFHVPLLHNGHVHHILSAKLLSRVSLSALSAVAPLFPI